jgi:hypothetical protein
MNRISKFIGVGAFALVFLALPSIASAQWYPGGNNGGYGGGNGGYGNGRYGNNDLRYVADRLVRQSKDFERRVDNTVDRQDDRGGWGNNRGGVWGNNRSGGYYNDDLKELAGDFRRAAEHFEDKYGNGRDLRNSERAAGRLLDAASRMDNALRNSGGRRGGRNNSNINGQWNSMRGDINAIAQTYGYNGGYNRGGNNNRYPNRNGDWRNRIPFPLPF